MTKKHLELGEDLNFFPLTGLQLGKWQSAFHLENQLFLFIPGPSRLVFLAVHPLDPGQVDFSYLLTLPRKTLLKQFGRHSPFAAPVKRRSCSLSPSSHTFLWRLSADYWGVTAVEFDLGQLTGFDYYNTLVSFGSRVVLEAESCRKRWFPNVLQFCAYYDIEQGYLPGALYTPVLNKAQTLFETQQMYPRNASHLTSSTNESLETQLNSSYDNEDQEDAAAHHTELKHCTLIAYFDDPVLPFFMKKLVMQPTNKRLLRMYERGIPSWAVFLPSYGLPYRAWMRTVMTVLIFIVSLSTMLLGFFDLYKHIPVLREMLIGALGQVFQFLDTASLFKDSVLLGYLVATSAYVRSAFLCMVDLIQECWEFFVSVCEYITPLMFVLKFFFTILKFFLEQLRDFTLITLSLPFDCVGGVCRLLWTCAWGGFSFITELAQTFRNTSQILNANKQAATAMQTLSLWARVKAFWQDVFRHIVKGVSSLYNFTVYSSVNLYKYRESTWKTWLEYRSTHQELFVRRIYQVCSVLLLYALIKYCCSKCD